MPALREMIVEKEVGTSLIESPLIFPSRISHRRFQPKQHAFSYSYLTVGIPIGWTGCSNGFLSVDVPPGQAKGWLHVDAADHLSRTTTPTDTLRSKLDAYLASQGVDPTAYPHALLICQPTVLRYQFNPASFWHLYSADLCLKAMIVEVNNTFDERRMYFLNPDSSGQVNSSQDLSRWHMSWEKDFHVSPFNSRLGSYSLTSRDPLQSSTIGDKTSPQSVCLDNTITLSTSDGSPKLVARVWSTQQPLNPESMSSVSQILLLQAWWWVGLATFPRIVYEAYRLYFTHKLHVWYRPEVLPTSSGRTPTSEERIIERYFRAYLRHTVSKISSSMRIIYHSPQAFDGGQLEEIKPWSDTKDTSRQVTLNIGTPEFFSRIVHYIDPLNGISKEFLDPELKNRTGWASDETLLAELLKACKEVSISGAQKHQTYNTLWVWSYLSRYLRTAPADMSYPWPAISHPKGKAPRGASPSQAKTWSLLDDYVLAVHAEADACTFFKAQTFVFASKRYALGFTALLCAEVVIIVTVLISFGPLCALAGPVWFGASNINSG